MFIREAIAVLLLTAAAANIFVGTSASVAATETTRFLQSSTSPSVSFNDNNLFSQEQFPFQLLSSPQFGNLLGLFYYNITKPQSSNQPQSEVDAESRVLHPQIVSTLPFNELNLTEFSWLWENALVNGSSINLNSSNQEVLRPEPKLFGGGNGSTTYGDLYFLTRPQLVNLFGRR